MPLKQPNNTESKMEERSLSATLAYWIFRVKSNEDATRSPLIGELIADLEAIYEMIENDQPIITDILFVKQGHTGEARDIIKELTIDNQINQEVIQLYAEILKDVLGPNYQQLIKKALKGENS